jgi:glycosyltransferase involved in cell wall biosynthesis
MTTIFTLGTPGPKSASINPASHAGGAGSELWHTLRLWRELNWTVSSIPTWEINQAWSDKLASIGVNVVRTTSDNLESIPGLAGSIVVSFCNVHCLALMPRLRAMGCRVVWVPCMNWPFPAQYKLLPEPALIPDRVVFQSRYQRDQLLPFYRSHAAKIGDAWDDSRWAIIPGAFYVDEFPFDPKRHKPGTPFVVGRMSRAAADKYPTGNKHGKHKLWEQYSRILHPIHARVMGWSNEIANLVGRPPAWSEALPEGSETPQTFLASLHCYLPGCKINAKENWPRVGMEAMAAGVPVIAERVGGWPEMIVDGYGGLLADSPDHGSYLATDLAYRETARIRLVESARNSVESLAHPGPIGNAWSAIMKGIT